ncbi:hypothetical protein H2509_11330 [Stappia sp. F7233]|uniref:Uncharacterized protein n=1 Tax=Stappia albiluteola TaxID=2758565 RepID=A0A839AF34_9HYPH|nr:hypothetical protein [Stappia albiluteola]
MSGRRAPSRRKPTRAQIEWLRRGLGQAGGKLPLFDAAGREISAQTIRACIAAGWAEPWFSNPIKPDWLVCRLTEAGLKVLGQTSPRDG